MKKVLLTVSLLANVVLAGALIYTTMEINKLDEQRENLQIANDQLERKLDGSTSTSEGASEAIEEGTGVSTTSTVESYTDTTESTARAQETPQAEAATQGKTMPFTLYGNLYYFDGFNGRIAEREGLAKMQENATVSPVTVSMVGGTTYNNADLYTNTHDNTATIVVDGKTILSGTYEHEGVQ